MAYILLSYIYLLDLTYSMKSSFIWVKVFHKSPVSDVPKCKKHSVIIESVVCTTKTKTSAKCAA